MRRAWLGVRLGWGQSRCRARLTCHLVYLRFTTGEVLPARLPAFGHGVEVTLEGGPTLLGCYHVSQQNTFTGRLTEPMLDAVFLRAKQLVGTRGGQSPAPPPGGRHGRTTARLGPIPFN